MKTSASKGIISYCILAINTSASLCGACGSCLLRLIFLCASTHQFKRTIQFNLYSRIDLSISHSQEFMKTSTSKGRSTWHTPASVHAICFIPFEADLFMASTQYCIRTIYFHLYSRIDLSIYLVNIEVEVEVELDVIWQRLRLRCFTLQYHPLPTSISKISSKHIIFVNKMNNKYIYDSKNNIAWRWRHC